MRTVRIGTFETNSSSTHALVILSKDDYRKWQNNEVVLDLIEDCIKPLDPNKNIVRHDDGSVDYNGNHFANMYELMEEEYEDIDDEYAIAEYVEQYAQVEQKELGDNVIMSIYRGERW